MHVSSEIWERKMRIDEDCVSKRRPWSLPDIWEVCCHLNTSQLKKKWINNWQHTTPSNRVHRVAFIYIYIIYNIYTGWRTKCHTIDCARNTFLLLQKHLTTGTELILIGWKIVPNERHVQCDHRFASQPLANEPLHSSQLFDTNFQKARGTTSLCGPW